MISTSPQSPNARILAPALGRARAEVSAWRVRVRGHPYTYGLHSSQRRCAAGPQCRRDVPGL